MNTITQARVLATYMEGVKSGYWAVERKFRRLAWQLKATHHLAKRPVGFAGDSRAYQRFLILAHARSGSNLLADGLGNDPRILSYAEIFHRTEVFIHPLEATEPLCYLKREMPLRFLKEAIYGGVNPNVEAVGFKVFPEHLEASSQMLRVREWLASQADIAVINLTRRNLLRYYVSLKQAWVSGQWRLPASRSGARPPSITLHVDAKDAERIFAQREERDSSCRALFRHHPVLNLHYEDLQDELQPTFARVQSFLGVEPRTVRVAQLKQENRTLPEIIENYDELRRRWTGTRWERFLEE